MEPYNKTIDFEVVFHVDNKNECSATLSIQLEAKGNTEKYLHLSDTVLTPIEIVDLWILLIEFTWDTKDDLDIVT